MSIMSKEKNAEYQRKWYQENKKLQQQRNKQGHKRRRDFITNYKADRGCSRCDEKHVACLQFHHRNPAEKDFSITDLLKYHRSMEILMKEIEKCEVICANCHLKHHWQDRLDKDQEHDII